MKSVYRNAAVIAADEHPPEDAEILLKAKLITGSPHFRVSGAKSFHLSQKDYGALFSVEMRVVNPEYVFTKWPWWNVVKRFQQRRIKTRLLAG
jgi:hypothetical protein